MDNKALIENSVKEWAKQSCTIAEVTRHIITWQDLSFALYRVRNINPELLDNFVSELNEEK